MKINLLNIEVFTSFSVDNNEDKLPINGADE